MPENVVELIGLDKRLWKKWYLVCQCCLVALIEVYGKSRVEILRQKNKVSLLIVHNNGEAGLAVQFKQMQNKKILLCILTFFL